MCRKYSCNNLNTLAKCKCARRNGTNGRIFLHVYKEKKKLFLRRAVILPTRAGNVVPAHLQMCRKVLYEVVPHMPQLEKCSVKVQIQVEHVFFLHVFLWFHDVPFFCALRTL